MNKIPWGKILYRRTSGEKFLYIHPGGKKILQCKNYGEKKKALQKQG